MIECMLNVRVIKCFIRVAQEKEQVASHTQSLLRRQQTEFGLIDDGRMRQRKSHAHTITTLQIQNKKSGQMKSHSFRVEETQAAVAAVEVFGADAPPVILFILFSIGSTGHLICIIIQTLGLKQADTRAECHSKKGCFNERA